jgi:sulfoxide reductase catalytic subunit YedY
MLIKNTRHRPDWNCSENEVTDERGYFNRRQILAGLASFAAMPWIAKAKTDESKNAFATDEPQTSEYSATHYNNFYEFALTKDGPARLSQNFKPLPWHVIIEGEVEKPGRYSYEDLLNWATIEERIYRFRCVEAWSMVIPWQGFELRQLIKQVKPTSRAKYLEFQTLHDPSQMPGQRRGALGFFTLDWPYTEGLRMDEAMHPLTLLVNGVYGKPLPAQNGAPLRLIVPWKYGFKSIKSIVKIRFVEKQPINTWQKSASNEYGFYANVNPQVDHPRWSQKTERRIVDESLFGTKRIATKPFNGYAEHVAHLYQGMDLRTYF